MSDSEVPEYFKGTAKQWRLFSSSLKKTGYPIEEIAEIYRRCVEASKDREDREEKRESWSFSPVKKTDYSAEEIEKFDRLCAEAYEEYKDIQCDLSVLLTE